ncbi:MAG TPA: FG-GAP-like repeat-containing protein [Phycisphaerae bacterium]
MRISIAVRVVRQMPGFWLCGLVAAASVGSGTAAGQSYFLELSTTRLLPQPDPMQYSNAVDIGDANGDGFLDILFANGAGYSSASPPPQQQRLYINVGNTMPPPNPGEGPGYFHDESSTRLIGITAYARDMDFADVDNDGDLDIVVAQTFGNQPMLLINDGTGVYTNMTASLFPTITLWSEEASLADVDDDGDLDIYFCNGNQTGSPTLQDQLFINHLNEPAIAKFLNETNSRLPIQNVPSPMDIDWVDIDGDLDLDALIARKGGTTRVYRNDGAGHFTDITTGNIPTSGSSYSIAPADIDGDIDIDLFTINGGGATDQMFGGSSVSPFFTNITTTALPGVNNPAIDDNDSQFVDVDSDGDFDFVVASLGSTERLYINNGSGVFSILSGAFTAITDSSLDIAVGDLNNDGKPDVVTGQGESGSFRNRLYLGLGASTVADTRAPTFPNFTTLGPSANSNPNGFIVRSVVRDQITGDNGAFFHNVRLHWNVIAGGSGSGIVDMRYSGGEIYRGVIPDQAGGSTVEYFITALDWAGNTGTSITKQFNVTVPNIPPTIASSDPANGFIDILQDQSAGNPQGVSALTITFSEPVVDLFSGGPLTPASFSVILTSNLSGLPALTITSVTPGMAANSYVLAFNRPIVPGAWNTIKANVKDSDGATILASANSVDLGFLPGDSDGNSTVNTQDLLSLIGKLNVCASAGTCATPAVVAGGDMNRDGTVNTQDLLRLVQLLNGTDTQNVWNGVVLPPQP